MRETSVEALQAIQLDGTLSKSKQEAYAALYENGPLTGSELNVLLRTKNAHKRLSELVACGVAREVGFRPCSRTGRRAIIWDVTASLPRHVVRPAGLPRPSADDVRFFVQRVERNVDPGSCESCEGDGYNFADEDGRMVKKLCVSCDGTGKSKRFARVVKWLRARFLEE